MTGTPRLMPEACCVPSRPSHHKTWGTSSCCQPTSWTQRLLGTGQVETRGWMPGSHGAQASSESSVSDSSLSQG